MLTTDVFLVLGIVLLVWGAELLVRGAARIAAVAGISALVVGLTVVAFGTSAPELSVSVASAYKGQADLALGNVVGSNIFNILCVLGFSSIVSPAGIQVSQAALAFDIPVMIGVALAAFPIFLAGYRVSRFEGLFMLVAYVGYTVYLILTATQHEALGTYQTALTWFVLPMAGVMLLTLLVKGVAGQRKAGATV